MKTTINSETITLFFDKLAQFFNNFFPGIIILELFFDIGIFSNPPTNIFTFILYVVWCGILSIPFRWLVPSNIDFFVPRLQKELLKKDLLDEDSIDKNSRKDAGEEFELGFIIIKLIITIILYYLIIQLPITPFCGIPTTIINLTIVLFAMSIISYLLSFPYAACFKKILINAAEKLNK
jgi:hypothetical protein